MPHILAVDVGSTSAKLGWFPAAGDCASKPSVGLPIAAPRLAMPESVLRIEHARTRDEQWLAGLDEWLENLGDGPEVECLVGSVHSGAAEALCRRLEKWKHGPVVRLTPRQLPIDVRTAEPDRVGVDRLLGAVAANCLRSPGVPAITIDMGTAITVNLIAADGAFEGGAILAGPGTALRALHEATASLPLLYPMYLGETPPAVGKTTVDAMQAGAFWGSLGAIRELVQRTTDQCDHTPELFLTGGGSHEFAPLLALGQQPARHVPHLVLAGIHLVAQRTRH